MIRYRLRELMADYQFKNNNRLTFDELAKTTNIHRTTLSKIANHRSYNTTTDNIDRLCEFFDCEVGELMEYLKNIDA